MRLCVLSEFDLLLGLFCRSGANLRLVNVEGFNNNLKYINQVENQQPRHLSPTAEATGEFTGQARPNLREGATVATAVKAEVAPRDLNLTIRKLPDPSSLKPKTYV